MELSRVCVKWHSRSSHTVCASTEILYYLWKIYSLLFAAVITNETSLAVALINICIFILVCAHAHRASFVLTSAYWSYAAYAASSIRPIALLHDVYTTLQRIAGCLLIFSRSDFSTCTHTLAYRLADAQFNLCQGNKNIHSFTWIWEICAAQWCKKAAQKPRYRAPHVELSFVFILQTPRWFKLKMLYRVLHIKK